MSSGVQLGPRIPVSTYRLQFNSKFRFSEAKDIPGYLHDLGITDIYSSPLLKAKKGSLHGYDIIDHSKLNPEIGSEAEFDEFVDELRKFGMGLILDIVPNHMCVTDPGNEWWMDVLENGPSSRYASYFDVDWEPVNLELRNQVLLPVLGDQYGKALEAADLQVAFEDGSFFLKYFEHEFPLRPKTYAAVLTHGLDQLRAAMGEDDPHVVELLSIVTSLEHLPPYTEAEREKISERSRKKEIIKKRLRSLYAESGAVRQFIDDNIVAINGTKGDPGSFDRLDSLIREQAYRLAYWRVAAEEINYRRFFDINELAAIRVENPQIYEDTHALLFRFVRKGKVTGLRVDHPDGLYDPSEYFRWLQRDCFLHARLGHLDDVRDGIPSETCRVIGEEGALYAEPSEVERDILAQYRAILDGDPQYKPFYIVGEKILIKGERMPEDWSIFSTTGYVFLNSVNGIFVEQRHAKIFSEIYHRFTREKMLFPDIACEKKKLVMRVAMSSEMNSLGARLNRISEKNRHTRDFTLNSLTNALIEIIAYFPVYRTYVTSAGITDRDRQYIELAVSKARRKNPVLSGSLFEFIKDVLLLNYYDSIGENDKKAWLEFVMRFQQLSGPVMAKGVEDTAFYIYNRLISLNEVGGMPERFGTPLETFHGQNIERTKFWPQALITTSTHDTKRSEDVRARIDVLSEIPDEWSTRLAAWRRLNYRKKMVINGQRVPDRNEEYLLYQTLIGAWPAVAVKGDGAVEFLRRIKDYMLKALREAKINTSWINPDHPYEEATTIFIERILETNGGNEFLGDFTDFQKKVSNLGMYNSLSQVLIKITSPGVPDFYQGTELWDFSLVDPDNRRPVDFESRQKTLKEMSAAEKNIGPLEFSRQLVRTKENGMIKLYVTAKALSFRRAQRDIFEHGDYTPLEIYGKLADNVCSFARRLGNSRVIVAVPRLLANLVNDPLRPPCGDKIWGGTLIAVPYADKGVRYRNIFTGELLTISEKDGNSVLSVPEVFAEFPLALLERIGD